MNTALVWGLLAGCAGDDPSGGDSDTDGQAHSGTVTTAPTGDPTETGAHTGQPEAPPTADVVLSTDERLVLEEIFTVTLSRDTPTHLQCTSPDDPGEDHRLVTSGATAELLLFGLLAETTYDCTLWWPAAGDTALWTGSFTTPALPSGLPTLLPSGDAGRAIADDGYVLVSHWRKQSGPPFQRLVIADGGGRVRWYAGIPDATAGFTGAWTGDRLVVGGGTVIPPGLRDLSNTVLYEGPPPESAYIGYNHEARLTPEGWVLGLQAVDDPRVFKGFLLEARDPADGSLAWSWDSRDHADVLPAPPGPTANFYHPNAAEWRDDDGWGPSVWVSLRGIERIVRIDRATGDLTHEIGPDTGWRLVDGSGADLPPEDWFWVTHQPAYQGSDFVVYDNGVGRPGARLPYSRVAHFHIESDGVLRMDWEWTEPGFYEPNFGSTQYLPNGRVLVGSGHDIDVVGGGGEARTSFVAELDAGELVWRLDFGDPRDTFYRAQWIDGCTLFANAGICGALSE